ncbi:hypothetical protein SRHO_G00171180 [Serrasalmus rhombeus]
MPYFPPQASFPNCNRTAKKGQNKRQTPQRMCLPPLPTSDIDDSVYELGGKLEARMENNAERLLINSTGWKRSDFVEHAGLLYGALNPCGASIYSQPLLSYLSAVLPAVLSQAKSMQSALSSHIPQDNSGSPKLRFRWRCYVLLPTESDPSLYFAEGCMEELSCMEENNSSFHTAERRGFVAKAADRYCYGLRSYSSCYCAELSYESSPGAY